MLMRMYMSAIIIPPTEAVTPSEDADNAAILLYLVALFYEKGDRSTAVALLRGLQE